MKASLSCQHTSHLFYNPLCESQSLVKRIANIIFHIVTLGIPFVFYHVISYCYRQPGGEVRERIGVPTIPKIDDPEDSPVPDKPSPLPVPDKPAPLPVAPKTLDDPFLVYSRELLEKYPEIQDCDWDKEACNGAYADHTSVCCFPNNDIISRLVGIMRGPLWESLVRALKDNQQNTWDQQAVLTAADDLLQACMAIFILTLEDFEGITHPDTGDSLENILCAKIYYQNRTMYYMWDIYTLLKLGIIWNEEKKALTYPECIRDIVVESNTRFFTPYKIKVVENSFPNGLYQQKWKGWFNLYCEQFADYLKKDESCKVDAKWLPKEDHSYLGGVFDGKYSEELVKISSKTDRCT